MKKYLILILLFFPFFANASLVKNPDSDKVYNLQNGYQHWIRNADIFNSYGFDWSDIQTTDSVYPNTDLIKLADSDKVYYIKNETKHWIATAEDFTKMGFDWKAIQTINQKEFNIYQNEVIPTPAIKQFSDTIVKISFNGITPMGACPVTEICNSSLSLADRNNIFIATIGFDVNALGFEGARLSKITFKQLGTIKDEDYSNLQLVGVYGDIMAKAEPINDEVIFYPNIDLDSNVSKNTLNFRASFAYLSAGKIYQFKLDNLEITGKISGLPVIQNIPNNLTSVMQINVLK